jgi:hypothetical protein
VREGSSSRQSAEDGRDVGMPLPMIRFIERYLKLQAFRSWIRAYRSDMKQQVIGHGAERSRRAWQLLLYWLRLAHEAPDLIFFCPTDAEYMYGGGDAYPIDARHATTCFNPLWPALPHPTSMARGQQLRQQFWTVTDTVGKAMEPYRREKRVSGNADLNATR